MMWVSPFSFRRRVGRLQFAITIIAAVLLATENPFPLKYGWIEQVVMLSWLNRGLLAGLMILVTWVLASACVQRLNDLELSWKWVIGVIAAFPVIVALRQVLGGENSIDSAGYIIFAVLMFLLGIVATYGLGIMLFSPAPNTWNKALHENDLRRFRR